MRHGVFDGLEKRRIVDGLLEDRAGARVFQARNQARVGPSRDDYHGKPSCPDAHGVDELEPVHARHVYIGDQATWPTTAGIGQEIGARGVVVHLEAAAFEKRPDGIADGRVVIDEKHPVRERVQKTSPHGSQTHRGRHPARDIRKDTYTTTYRETRL